MADGATINVKVDISKIENKFNESKMEAVQYSLANKVIKDAERFVPMKKGNLRDSVGLVGGGKTINYNMSYAYYQYYKKYRNYTTAGTGPRWDQAAKAAYLEDWIRLVKRRVLNG